MEYVLQCKKNLDDRKLGRHPSMDRGRYNFDGIDLVNDNFLWKTTQCKMTFGGGCTSN